MVQKIKNKTKKKPTQKYVKGNMYFKNWENLPASQIVKFLLTQYFS